MYLLVHPSQRHELVLEAVLKLISDGDAKYEVSIELTRCSESWLQRRSFSWKRVRRLWVRVSLGQGWMEVCMEAIEGAPIAHTNQRHQLPKCLQSSVSLHVELVGKQSCSSIFCAVAWRTSFSIVMHSALSFDNGLAISSTSEVETCCLMLVLLSDVMLLS